MSIPGLRGHLRAVSTHYVSKHRLKQIKSFGAPILVVTGTHDHLVRAKNSYKLSEVLEPDEFLVFEGAGHAVNMECLEDFCEAVVRNVKRAEDKGNSTEESGDSPLDDEDKEETTPVTASADAEKGKHKAEE
jgi:surfactin synthase thioesterase subunit